MAATTQAMGSTATQDAPVRLGGLLARLDQIRRELDRDDLDLEDQLTLYREGCGHVARAKQILNFSRAEVELLMQDPGVEPAVTPHRTE